VEGELEVLEGAPPSDEPLTEIDIEVVVVEAPPDPGGDRDGPESEDSGAAVDALFARLRASHSTDPEPGDPLPAPAPEPAAAEVAAPEPEVSAPEAEPEEKAEPEQAEAEDEEPDAPAEPDRRAEVPAAEAAPSEPEPEPEVESDEPRSPDDELRAARDAVLTPLARDLNRAAKRALQDQQNELLDKIRTIKGKLAADEVLPTVEDQEGAWVKVLDGPLRAAYARAYADLAVDGGGADAEVPGELLEEVAHAMVEPWRVRLVSAIDGAGDDADAITQRLGSRYREYRGRELEDALGDALAGAWARGAYAAVPDGTLLRWIPAEVGRCPDCDDNALEPTAKGSEFPTGQLHPPAHPGCRCFLALAEPATA
jgi:hypothetical protein